MGITFSPLWVGTGCGLAFAGTLFGAPPVVGWVGGAMCGVTLVRQELVWRRHRHPGSARREFRQTKGDGS